jgi:hypothetical protein
MCKYYAHSHPCGHVKTIFAAFCPKAALVQKTCGKGEIWATVKIEKDCAHCFEEQPEPTTPRSKGRKRIVGRR